MLVDAIKMLADIPGSLHVTVEDAGGVEHDGVQTYTSETRGVGEYGNPMLTYDTVYVATPFEAPRALLRVSRDGESVVRRIVAVTDNVVFLAIELGEEVRA